jgi:uncharacterized phage protein (TIGR01671 family)
MKRQLKFRAFFKDDMHYNHSVSLSLNGIVHYLDTDGEWKCDIEGNGEDIGVIVMQYTGLNDRHGTEIYEGDIIKRNSNLLRNSPVVFVSGSFIVKEGEDENGIFGIRIRTDFEVIGNIYQHPELLKEVVK